MEEDRDNAGTNDETLQESAPDSVGFLFFNSQGKTYMRRKHKEPQQLFHFTLSKAGILKSHRVSGEGKYIYILRSKVHDDFVLRYVSLNSQSFTSRMNFSRTLTKQAHGIFIHVSDINAELLSRYFEWLETEYDEKPHQIFHETSYIGYQRKDNVWVLSNQLQIKNNRVLPEIEWTNMVLGEELYECYVTFNERLLDMEYLTSVFKKIFRYSEGFGANRMSFLQAMSFASLRILNSTVAEAPADESKYCCLYSAAKGLGKTKTLELIASGEGVGDRSEHSFMIGGGNGGQAGMTSKMQQDVYCQTNMIVILNEIFMKSKVIAETLNQCHDGFGMGSLSTGRKASRATIMGSSNELLHQRLDGRMMMIHYYECKHTNEMEKVLNEHLDPLFDQNKGCILAWCMRHQDFWEYVKTDIRYRLHSVIERVLPKKQRRYRWALTGNVLVLYMMFITSKVRCEPVSVFEAIVKAENSPKEDVFMRFKNNFLQMITSSTEVFTWVNPCCSFTDEDGHSVEAIAISATKFNRFSDVSPLEMKSVILSYGTNAWQKSTRFCKEANSTIADVNKAGKVKDIRAHKISWSEFSSSDARKIRNALSMPRDDSSDHDESADEPQQVDVDKEAINEVFSTLKRLYTDYFSEGLEATSEDIDGQGDDQFPELTPESRKRYTALSPHSRAAFTLGFECAKKRRLIFDEDPDNRASGGATKSDGSDGDGDGD